jgi:hypothetical protein
MGSNINFQQELLRRIRKAEKILGNGCDENEIKKSLLYTHARANYRQHQVAVALKPQNKKQKQALERVGRSLSRLIITLKDENLLHSVRNKLEVDRLSEHLKRIEKLACSKLPKPKPSSNLQRIAVRQAAHLLDLHNLSRTTSRNGAFCRLATVLYGDGAPDLFEHCRKYHADNPILTDRNR